MTEAVHRTAACVSYTPHRRLRTCRPHYWQRQRSSCSRRSDRSLRWTWEAGWLDIEQVQLCNRSDGSQLITSYTSWSSHMSTDHALSHANIGGSQEAGGNEDACKQGKHGIESRSSRSYPMPVDGRLAHPLSDALALLERIAHSAQQQPTVRSRHGKAQVVVCCRELLDQVWPAAALSAKITFGTKTQPLT